MTILEVSSQLRQMGSAIEKHQNWDKKTNFIVDFPQGMTSATTVAGTIGDFLNTARLGGAFDHAYFADLRPGMIGQAGHSVSVHVFRWLEEKGFRVAGINPKISPFERLAKAFDVIHRNCDRQGATTANDSDLDDMGEFPPGEWVDPKTKRRYQFGRRLLLWEIWRALRIARRRLIISDFVDRVPKWKDATLTSENVKQALSSLRKFWKSKKRPDLANSIDNSGGSAGLRRP